jgi:two-component system NtrC family sensor kinase
MSENAGTVVPAVGDRIDPQAPEESGTAVSAEGPAVGHAEGSAVGHAGGSDGRGRGIDADGDWDGFVSALGGRLPGVVLEVATKINDAVFVSDADGRIIWANAEFARQTGRPRQELIGLRRTQLYEGPSTPQRERAIGELAAMRSVSGEFPLRDATGVNHWVALTALPLYDDAGLIDGMVGIERDVTEQREAQRRRQQALLRAESLTVALEHEKRLLSMVIGTIPHMVWWKESDLRYTGCNEAYLRLRGLTDQLDLLGRRDDQLEVTHEIGPRLVELERQVLDTGRPAVDVKVVLEDSGRTFQFSVLPYLDNGRIAGVVGVGADISHATELERQLAQANRLEAIGQLAAGVAHEINTPVQYASDNTRFVADTVTGLLAGLRQIEGLVNDPQGTADERLRERVAQILTDLDLGFVAEEVPNALVQSLEGLDRVAQIVRAMKDFSHPGHGRSQADLNRLITSTAQVSRNEWKYVAELELDLDPAVGLVSCYEGDLKQVVLNIIVNAAHAIEELRRGRHLDRLGHIVVASRLVGDEVRVTVTDDGIGMDEATMNRVFDPFFTTKEVGKGTGQGLTLARSTMKKHGGRIDVTSKLGEGSTFSIVLPLKDPGAGSADAAGAPAPAVDAAATDRRAVG